jgi:hypothetical protein
MHGWRGTEGCDGRRRRLVRLMWPAARVEAEAPPSPATATSPSRFSVLPPRTTSYQLAAVAAREQECVDSPRPLSPGSFIKVRLRWVLQFNFLAHLYENSVDLMVIIMMLSMTILDFTA